MRTKGIRRYPFCHEKESLMKEKREVFDLIVVGYGAAGLMAGASVEHKRVLILEKNERAGKKVLISGKGQCNFTHKEKTSEFVKHYGAHANFVKHALGKWTPEQELNYFESLGVDHVVMDNGKVFPKSLSAEELVGALVAEAVRKGVHVLYKRRVEDVVKTSEGIFCIEVLSLAKGEMTLEKYYAKNVLITTGGMTYPVTGSEGDGYHMAKQLGHSIVSPKAALAPIYHGDASLKELSGVSISKAAVRHSRNGKTIGHYQDDLLFTHKGLSGPVILNNSRDFLSGDELFVSFTEYNGNDLEARILKMAAEKGKSTLLSGMRDWCFTRSMADCLYSGLGLPLELTFGELDKVKRKLIVQKLTNYSIRIASVGGSQIGMATAGGVSLEEVKAKTMASKFVEGLYFAGEVLDVDGDTGGYNIQWAFSSAKAALNDINSKL